ncbi:hypothetical protein [Bradyrhizobium canariense]|uniref:hypothetical protein n=1 Tax=Bradyrhizobium canariense TaxID=255045 RepID=UPI0011774644|nr:hypothetical protein [Bradyrhizobium canariense]
MRRSGWSAFLDRKGSGDCHLWKEDRAWFFLADPTSGRTLWDVRRDYIEAMAVDSDEAIRITMATMMKPNSQLHLRA